MVDIFWVAFQGDSVRFVHQTENNRRIPASRKRIDNQLKLLASLSKVEEHFLRQRLLKL
jgi:hypothetical protein